MMSVKFKRIGNHNLPLPSYESEFAVGFDLRARKSYTLRPGDEVLVPCGWAVELPPAYGMYLFPRSGLGVKFGIVLSNLTGVIDSDYRGEIMVSLWYRRTEGKLFKIEEGDRICQGVLMPRIVSDFVEVDELNDTKRSTGGFGSSGVK